MLTTLTTLASVALTQLPEPPALPEALDQARIEVTLQATSNHFAAENASHVVQVLLVGAEGLPPHAVRLAPGARVLYPFPRHVVDGLAVEVVALDENGWRESGAFPLETIQEARAVWIQAGPDRSVPWIRAGEEGDIAHLLPTDDLVPEAWRRTRPELRHVPVPLPSEDKKSGKPPVIEEKKLPPV